MTDLRRLPNLPALRAFEAAARHQNFSRAADEIHVTHGAISHQVRALEEELGVPLFTRHGKRITITADGERFAAILGKSLMDIALAAEALKAGAGHKRLTVTALQSFAARWLAPHLGSFIELYPDTEVVLQSSNNLTDFVREAIDVGVRFGAGHYPGLSVESVMDDYFYPVASPKFNGGNLPRSLEELVQSPLLRSDLEPWTPWFEAAGISHPEPKGGLLYPDASILARAATEGLGVALGRHSIVMRDIAAGDLVRLSDITVKCPFSYYLVCLPSALQKPQVQAFRTWLFDEVREFKKV